MRALHMADITVGSYKREAYRGSEFAPRILAEHGVPVVMKVSLGYSQVHHVLSLACRRVIIL